MNAITLRPTHLVLAALGFSIAVAALACTSGVDGPTVNVALTDEAPPPAGTNDPIPSRSSFEPPPASTGLGASVFQNPTSTTTTTTSPDAGAQNQNGGADNFDGG